MTKFHFLVPLLPKVMAGKRWLAKDNPGGKSVEATLTNCLNSLGNQTAAENVVVHLGCHEFPPLDKVKWLTGDNLVSDHNPVHWQGKPGPWLVVHRAWFPTPPKMDLVTYNKLSGKVLPSLPTVSRRRRGDKYSKVKLGFASALTDPNSEFVMIVDADDLIHRDVARYALDNDSPGGHTVTSGYGWRLGDDYFREMGHFFAICGSCNAVRVHQWEKDRYLETNDINCWDRPNYWLYAGHASMHKRLRNSGFHTSKFPFRAAVYVVGTGSNISGTSKAGKNKIPLDADLKAQFGLD